ncbi:MAG: hypothetical protein JW820_15180 [Spirochaetales bacterium]|nr:hypothetical protein [Spirochaetales bacterium]
MVEKPFLPSLRLSAGTPVNLRSGDFIFVRVLERLGEGSWAVGIKGRVVRAVSNLELVPGQRLRARVMVEQGRTVLRLEGGREGQVESLLRRAGLPQEMDVRLIVTAFLRSGLAVRSEQVLEVRRLLEKLRLDPRRAARLAALALEKGIDPKSPGLEELLPVLTYGDGREERRRYRGREMPHGRRELQKALTEGREEGSALQLFNHLRGREGTWVVVPLHFAWGSGGHLYGTLRLLYDEAKGASRRLVLVVEKEQEGEDAEGRAHPQWGFTLDRVPAGDPESGGERAYRMSAFCSDPEAGAAARAEFRRLRLKLQNLGVKTDDTIRIDDGFDGLSSADDTVAYRSVDLER